MKKNILLVDDERQFVENLKTALEMYDFEITVAYDGREAIEKFYSSEPDLVIMDLQMPNFDGEQVAITFKKVKKGRHIPIIVLSAIIDAERQDRLLRLGVEGCFMKPYDLERLIAKIKEGQKNEF